MMINGSMIETTLEVTLNSLIFSNLQQFFERFYDSCKSNLDVFIGPFFNQKLSTRLEIKNKLQTSYFLNF